MRNRWASETRDLSISFLLLLVVTSCNGMVASSGGSDGAANFSSCDDYRNAMESAGQCGAAANQEVVEFAYDECVRRAASAAPPCRASLDDMYECMARGLTCPRTDVDCTSVEHDYAECVSGGTCPRVRGGQTRQPVPGSPVTYYVNDEICQCEARSWDAGAAGESCRTWEDCAPVCCSCNGSSYEYTAAACEFTGGTSDAGTCPSKERVCAHTEARCAFGK
jgi:hypothetical protein